MFSFSLPFVPMYFFPIYLFFSCQSLDVPSLPQLSLEEPFLLPHFLIYPFFLSLDVFFPLVYLPLNLLIYLFMDLPPFLLPILTSTLSFHSSMYPFFLTISWCTLSPYQFLDIPFFNHASLDVPFLHTHPSSPHTCLDLPFLLTIFKGPCPLLPVSRYTLSPYPVLNVRFLFTQILVEPFPPLPISRYAISPYPSVDVFLPISQKVSSSFLPISRWALCPYPTFSMYFFFLSVISLPFFLIQLLSIPALIYLSSFFF